MPLNLTNRKTIRRVAVVGAGYFSQFHLTGWQAIPGVELVGLCDTDTTKAKTLATKFGVPAVFDSVDTMLTASSPDLVDVVTPPASQAAILETMLPKGLPIICQKPFGRSYAEALRFTHAAEKFGAELIVHENFRFMPWYREMQRLISTGTLGRLHGVSFRLRPGDGQGPNAYLDRQPYFQTMPRLLVAETAIHLIDTFRYLMGEVVAVSAQLRRLNPAIQGEDAALITFEFRNGATGLFDGNRLNDHCADNPRRTMGEMWLEGAKGVLRLDGNAHLWWKPHHGAEVRHPYDDCADDASFGAGACKNLQSGVVRNLAEGLPQENSARCYLKNLLIQEAVYLSHAKGQRIAMDSFEANHADALGDAPEKFTPRP